VNGLQNKVIIVAGGATGIGAATSRRLAAAGARVVVGDRNEEGAAATAATIADDGGRADPFAFDIADLDSCGRLVEFAVSTHGGLDGLFNVAADTSPGTLGRDTDLLSVPIDVWHRTLEVDLTGYFHTARQALPALLERGGGSIVNTVSGLVLNGDPIRVAYGAAKGGVIPLTRHIATRWGKDGIRCNAIAPGFVLTDQGTTNVSAEEQERLLGMVRSPRLGRPDDIAAMASFLLSDDGSWINGQLYPVNGGTGLR